jgi:hypothetical protein
MRINPIIVRLRQANTVFGNRIGGAAELELVRNSTGINADQAFVVTVSESVDGNVSEGSVTQRLVERFAVVAVLKNDTQQRDKLGFLANDRLHDVRSQLFRALLGRQFVASDGPIEYAGGQLLPLNPAYLWYQFSFQFPSRIIEFSDAAFCDVQGSEDLIEEELRGMTQPSQFPDLLRLYTNYILSPNADLPYTGDLPLDDGYPDVSLPDFAQLIDSSDDPNPGAFGRGFGSGYDFYKILNRRNDPK